MELFQRKVLLHAVLFTTTLLNTLQLSCCTTSCLSIGSPGCICTCTSTTSSLTTSTTSSTTSTSTSPSSETSSFTSNTSSTTSSTRETSTTSSPTSSSTAASTSSSTSASSTRFTTSRTTTTSSTTSTSSESPSTENDQRGSEIDSRTPEPTITTQSTQDNEANNITDDDSSSPSTGRNSEQDENGNSNSGSNSNSDNNKSDEYDQSVPTLSSDTTTQVAENNWNETDALNGTAFLIVEGSAKKVISIVLPLICCIVFVIILIIFLAKKYKKKTKFKNHIESQVTYDLEEDFDNTKIGDLGQGFSHGDTITVVAENLNSDNRRSEQEIVVNNTSLTFEQVLRLEGSVAPRVFSGNGKGLSNIGNNNKVISGNGSGTNFPQEHAQMNGSGKRLSCDEKKKKLVSGNGSGANFSQDHVLMKRSGLPEMDEGKVMKDPKPVAWDECNKSGDQIVSEKEVKHLEKQTTFLDDIPDIEEIPIVADEQDVEEIKTKTHKSSDSKETEHKFSEKDTKDKIIRQSSKAPVTHLSAADVEEF